VATSVPSVGNKSLVVTEQRAISPVDGHRGWITILESFAGAWQRNVEVKYDAVVSHHAVFACQTLIASDFAKCRVMLGEMDADRVWTETENASYSPVLRKPNHFQTRNQFFETWALSKLQRGNTLALKEYDGSQKVKALYILDWTRVTPLVSDSGEVFYRLAADHLSGIAEQIVVPADAVIHDRFNCLFHPLIGISPLFANGLTATQGLNIQKNAAKFFENAAIPGGMLLAPAAISDETARRLKEHWESNYSGDKAGKVAVLGDGLKFERMVMTSVESQMIEQLKWTAETICSTYHVPPYKIGVGALPSYNNVQALNVEYYSQCLQGLMEAAEECLDDGLGIGAPHNSKLSTSFDDENLLRMDTVTQMDVLEKGKSVMTLDERRRKIHFKKIKGGNTIYLQEQDHSLDAIAARDAQLIAQANKPAAAADDEGGTEEFSVENGIHAANSLQIQLAQPEAMQ
jgi:HK97 family phage portal protein